MQCRSFYVPQSFSFSVVSEGNVLAHPQLLSERAALQDIIILESVGVSQRGVLSIFSLCIYIKTRNRHLSLPLWTCIPKSQW